MNKATLEDKATKAFIDLAHMRGKLFSAAEKTIYLSMVLENEKASAVAAGKFDGKNAEIREAQAREFFLDKQTDLAIQQNAERAARYDFDLAQIEVDTVKTMLRIAELPE